MKTQNATQQTGGEFDALAGSATVLDEYVRLDKAILNCEHSLLVAERLKARGHTLPENEVDAVRLKLSEAMIKRDFMDEWMRRAKSPNDEASNGRELKQP